MLKAALGEKCVALFAYKEKKKIKMKALSIHLKNLRKNTQSKLKERNKD